MKLHAAMQMHPLKQPEQLQAEMKLRSQVAQAKNSTAALSNENADAPNHAALVKAANSFESTLMQELMKPLTRKDPLFSDDSSSSEEEGGVMESFGSESLAQALAANGGLGIAKMVVKQVERESAKKRAG